MNYCKKCGEIIKENAKFCSSCGSPNHLVNNKKANEMNTIKDKTKNNNHKIIFFAIIAILIIGIIGAVTFIKISSIKKENSQTSIDVLYVDTDNYPNVILTIQANNYSKDLEMKNFTLKEEDVFQKDLKLDIGAEENQYKISYKSSGKATTGERNVKIAYLEDGKETLAEKSYSVPEKAKNDTKTVNSNSNNVVNTYDNNEIDIKNAMDRYENDYIRMVNTKDTYYIKDAIDLSGSLINEFNDMLKSFSEQKINESLINHEIEEIKKISETQYQVTIYEKFNISYGKKNESKYTDFRTTYILNKTNSGFKVYAIKKTDNLGSK
ncbi:zinc ribbon domain-containing protein [Clostridium uliginosum]|uniref:Zinc-ribbon domain-containing protein n=1 Tax=Clostridium uliginosum TaxID=119641 RepID=A0A1I1JT51_9CLOT|nr:zinc ribbon domain-containing protein [Clostridium uliginosum]SFC51839.1 zinc-ribbon domain-containing protein [Clostridium uliginosum]